ncbi:tRNA (N6-threonylcarbamoyladenosine(37)-N6)-methyltransferase TrmO [Ihubacter sp. rT4E-8]|uniref:tRNA (N6-threonylcarbamoyladenosine(37)-N6)-methyltransferase TrmO n=1 Tax=unclassified Ihubacter TaxID=2633299 RepID=UPI003C79A49E
MEHMSVNITPIAYIQSPFLTKFGIPRQSGLTPSVTSRIVFRKDFASEEAVRGLSDFSHIWLIWGFSENQQKGWRPTVRPPRLGGNTRVGVFATRSPFRPNGLGLSSVKLEAIEKDPRSGLFILISGADLLDGTPIYDIKPYISTDSHPEAICGFQDHTKSHQLRVDISADLLSHVPTELQAGLLEILAQDPRPGYQDDPHRIYGLIYSNFNVQFTVANRCLRVVDIVLADTL